MAVELLPTQHQN